MTTLPSLPMYFPDSSTGFELSDSQTCAALVGVAYQQFTVWANLSYPSESDFSTNTQWQGQEPSGWAGPTPGTFNYSTPIWSSFSIKFLPFSEPFGFVATDNNGNAYVVFRGTMTTADGVMDGEIEQSPLSFVNNFGNVHDGFLGVYQGLRASLLAAVNALTGISNIFITGHSMGSALASLALADLANNANLTSINYHHYNFASPRVGDTTFAAAMNGMTFPSFRIINTEDLVPAAPPAITGSIIYQHFGYPIDFTAQYGSIDGNHSMADAYGYAIINTQNPFNPNPSPFANVVTAKGLGGHFNPLKIS